MSALFTLLERRVCAVPKRIPRNISDCKIS